MYSIGKFTTNGAWYLLRQRNAGNKDLRKILNKVLPFKFSFLTWKIWQGMILVSSLMYNWNSNIFEDCFYYNGLERKIINHLLLKERLLKGRKITIVEHLVLWIRD